MKALKDTGFLHTKRQNPVVYFPFDLIHVTQKSTDSAQCCTFRFKALLQKKRQYQAHKPKGVLRGCRGLIRKYCK